MAADGGAHIVDIHPAIELGEGLLYHLGYDFGILHTAGLGDIALAAVVLPIVEQMKLCADDGQNYSGKCYISQSGCVEDARQVAQLVEEAFPKLNGKVDINYVGTTIGSHTGPGTVALFFWGIPREH